MKELNKDTVKSIKDTLEEVARNLFVLTLALKEDKQDTDITLFIRQQEHILTDMIEEHLK